MTQHKLSNKSEESKLDISENLAISKCEASIFLQIPKAKDSQEDTLNLSSRNYLKPTVSHFNKTVKDMARYGIKMKSILSLNELDVKRQLDIIEQKRLIEVDRLKHLSLKLELNHPEDLMKINRIDDVVTQLKPLKNETKLKTKRKLNLKELKDQEIK